jgi:hypothetical protein
MWINIQRLGKDKELHGWLAYWWHSKTYKLILEPPLEELIEIRS